MADERAARALEALRRHGLDAALLCSPHHVCYVSGYEVPLETGPSPFAGGPPLALLDARGQVALVVQDAEEGAARASSADQVYAYPAFAYRERLDQPANAAAALVRALRDAGALGRRVGVEPAFLPWHLERVLQRECPGVELADATAALVEARLTKTRAEVELLRRAVRLTAVGQEAARTAARAGVSEIAAFSRIRAAMEEAAGRRVTTGADLVSGAERTAAVGGWPSDRVIAPGDLVLVDLSPRLGGYWGDSCNTLCAGEPTAEHRRMLRATTEALARGVEAARPGLRAAELDAVVRRCVEGHGYAYPHHSGHGLGTSVHEDPRLVPYEDMPLQPGMVLALEPGAYVPGVGGVRTEHVILVTAGAAEVLSSFAHGF